MTDFRWDHWDAPATQVHASPPFSPQYNAIICLKELATTLSSTTVRVPTCGGVNNAGVTSTVDVPNCSPTHKPAKFDLAG